MELQRQPAADPLSQPTRARLFGVLGELKRPGTTEELAGHLGLHPNGVRAHLLRLHRAGLVTRSRRRLPRGRPVDEWSIAPGARPGGQAPRGYEELSRWLAAATPASGARVREVEAAGREIGRELAPAASRELGQTFRSALSALGFQPAVKRRGSQITCTLGNCPYREAVIANQEVVCALHRGITQGLLDIVDPTARMTAFVPRDPRRAGCLIELEPAAGNGAA